MGFKRWPCGYQDRYVPSANDCNSARSGHRVTTKLGAIQSVARAMKDYTAFSCTDPGQAGTRPLFIQLPNLAHDLGPPRWKSPFET